MTAPGVCARNCGDESGGLPAGVRYLARQPILDRRGRVHAYELFYRDGPGSFFRGDGKLATQTMIDNSVLFGLQNLANGLPAFVNCTAETLTGEHIGVLPPAVTVLEILEDVEPSSAVIAACRRLRGAGYRLALDDFVYRPALEPLIRIADFIKIDYQNTSAQQRRTILRELGRFQARLLAEKIEKQSEYEEACNDGCTLFQGYFFCEPSSLKKRSVPANRAVHLRLLQMLQEDPLNLREISEVIKSEPALTYRLLRYVNSPLYGLWQPVRSIQSALILVGDDLFRRIGTLAVVSELNSGPSPEILRMALVRARFCEITSGLCSLNPIEQYLLGLFSLLPAMLQKPMDEALSGLPLSTPVREALLGTPSPLRYSLGWLEFHERGEFEKSDPIADARGLAGGVLGERFTQATLWADQLLAG
jgi:EAL and modified HD-GYP domain-containing signal transduction protein